MSESENQLVVITPFIKIPLVRQLDEQEKHFVDSILSEENFTEIELVILELFLVDRDIIDLDNFGEC